MTADVESGSSDGTLLDVRFGVVRSITYGLFAPPDRFVPQLRELGAGLVRIYVYWSQIEPEPGRFVFDVVDAFLEQLDGSEEVWVTICSSSTWATREATTFLPPSPATDPGTYERFVHQLVAHCRGRVRYWQCDNEPSNVGLLWAGTAADYVVQLEVMYRAVKDADPEAMVVLGGAPFGLPATEPDDPERRFFDDVLAKGGESFDLFDLHLYQDAERIPSDIERARDIMSEHGLDKPIVVGEYNAPWPELFPEAKAAMNEAMASAYAARLDGRSEEDTPERAAMAALYERMEDLPPQLQMFMRGCSPELDAKRDRINAREVVMRNLLALSAGVRRTVCWNLAPDVPNYEDPLSVMDLLFGKLPLMAYDGTELRRRRRSGEAFALLAEQLAGAERVDRVAVPGRPSMFAFDVRRIGRGPLLVVWEQRDPFDGEDQPPVDFDRAWGAPTAAAVDALGRSQALRVFDGRIRVAVSCTPIFITTAT